MALLMLASPTSPISSSGCARCTAAVAASAGSTRSGAVSGSPVIWNVTSAERPSRRELAARCPRPAATRSPPPPAHARGGDQVVDRGPQLGAREAAAAALDRAPARRRARSGTRAPAPSRHACESPMPTSSSFSEHDARRGADRERDKVLVNLATGLEDSERVTIAFLVAGAALERGREVAMFLTKEAVRLAVPGHARGRRVRRLPAAGAALRAVRGGRGRASGLPVLRQRAQAGLGRLRGQRPRGRGHADVGVARRRRRTVFSY